MNNKLDHKCIILHDKAIIDLYMVAQKECNDFDR